jgi:hypothetical protein
MLPTLSRLQRHGSIGFYRFARCGRIRRSPLRCRAARLRCLQTLSSQTSGDYTRLPQFVAGTVELETSNADPAAWCINGEYINLDAPANSAHTFDFWYRKSFALDDSNTTNWLLTNAPDVYLWAALLEASFFTADVEYGMASKARLEEAIRETEELAARSQSGAELRTDPGLRISRSRTGYFNFNTGL